MMTIEDLKINIDNCVKYIKDKYGEQEDLSPAQWLTLIAEEFGEFAQDTKTKLDEIYAKVENIPATSTTSINDLDTPIDVDSSDVSEDDSKSLAVLKPKEAEDTILVEKKGLFGKSKWVEQKK